MKLLKCPQCQTDIGFLNIVKALTPWHLRCASCDTPLMLASQRGAILAAGCASGAILALNALLLASALDKQQLYIPLGLFCLGLAALEATLYLHIRVSGLTLMLKRSRGGD